MSGRALTLSSSLLLIMVLATPTLVGEGETSPVLSDWIRPIDSDDPPAYDWISVLGTFSDGVVLHVYRKGSDHVGDNSGQILKRSSQDGGATWSAPEVIYDSPYDDRNLGGGIAANDSVIITLQRYDAPNKTVIDSGWLLSTDFGETWTYNAFDHGSFGNFRGDLVEIPDKGKIGVTGDGGGRLRIAWSTDGGKTFPTITDVSAPVTPNEPSAAYLGDGKLIMVWANFDSGDVYQSVSTDYGETWSSAKTNIVDGGYTAHGGWLGKSGDNLLWLYRYRDSYSPHYYAHGNASEVIGDSNAWTSGALSDRGGDGYGAITTLANATMLMTYSFSDREGATESEDQDLEYAWAEFGTGSGSGDECATFPGPTTVVDAGERLTITGDYLWCGPIEVRSGGVLEFIDAAVVGGFTREDEEALTSRLYLLDNEGATYVNNSRWEPYTYLPADDFGEAEVVYYSRERLEVRNSLVVVDAESDNEWDYLGPLWVRGGHVFVQDSILLNVTFWHGTPGMNSIGPMKNFTLENVDVWQNKTASHVKSRNTLLKNAVWYYGIFQTSRFGAGISGATSVDEYNFNFLNVNFNGRPLHGGTLDKGEDVVLALGPEEPVGGLLYFAPAHDVGDIVINGGNWSGGQGIRFMAARDGWEGPKGSVGNISVTKITCGDFEMRGSCNVVDDAAWNRRGSVLIADNQFYSTTDVPRMGMSVSASTNVTIERNWWHGNVSTAGDLADNAIFRNNLIDGFGSMQQGYDWRGNWFRLGSDVLVEENVFGNISSSSNILLVWTQSPVENITIRENYFGNISANPDTGEVHWIVGLYSGTNTNPGDAYSSRITVSKNTFVGAENWGNGYYFVATGCVCGTEYSIPWKVTIDNNTFDARNGNNRQLVATNYGSALIDSVIENNTFRGYDDYIPLLLQNNHGENFLKSNVFAGSHPYVIDFQNHGTDGTSYTIVNQLLDARLSFAFNENPYIPSIILRGNTMMSLRSGDVYYDPQFAFEDYFVLGRRGVEYEIDTTRWNSHHAEVRYEGFSATIPKAGWFRLTVDTWAPTADKDEVAVAWIGASTEAKIGVWFNATNLLPGQGYYLVVDNVKRESSASDERGTLSFLWSNWSSHAFEVRADPVLWTNTAPVIEEVMQTDEGTAEVAYTRRFSASDPDANQTLQWSLETNATFLTIHGQDRAAWVNGTPSSADKSRFFYVNLTVSDGGCGGACESVAYHNYTLFVSAPGTSDMVTTFDVGSSYEILSEDRVEFRAFVMPSGEYTYLWEFGDGTVSTEKNPTHHYQYAFSSRYLVRLTVCSETHCVQVVQQVTLVRWNLLAVVVAAVLVIALYNLAVVLWNRRYVKRALRSLVT